MKSTPFISSLFGSIRLFNFSYKLFLIFVSFTLLVACVIKKNSSDNTSASTTLEKINAPALQAPEEGRFVKETLVDKLAEPMELTVTPDNNILWIERKGSVNYYNAATKKAFKVKIPVKVFTGINDGIIGITLDPDFNNNRFVYIYYSPAGNIPKQHTSRFVFNEADLELKDEKVLLQIPTQRETCCHSAGSLAFGPDGNLYIGVGDNTSPRTEPAYAPVDERPGKESYDAQRTSANTDDLRGKILRIRPQMDGTYSIPEGNMFPKNGSKGRPEIFSMGARNPFRLSVDSKTGYVYFGDVGPDAVKADWYGPEAYDEVNVIKKPSNFGWPYFVGNNKPYPKYNFDTKTAGEFNNPNAPVNASPNNTGAKILPPIQAPLIWYNQGITPEFPELGKGGRTVMAGPVYHYNAANTNPNKFPEYFNNVLFIYEWMRDWIKAVRLDNDGNYQGMEAFLPNSTFASPMDMEFGSDGTIYMLEYGKGWYTDNPDARLVRISYVSGNRPPVTKAIASSITGSVPMRVAFSSEGTKDLDGDELTYEWRLLNNDEVTSREKNPVYEFTFPGIYQTKLTVTDSKGNKTESAIEIIAGNTQPQIFIDIEGNNTFYWPDNKVKYNVKVEDNEDGNLVSGKIKPGDVNVFLEYSTAAAGDNLSPVLTEQKKQTASEAEMQNHPGKVLIDQSDCRSCHAADKNSIGPSYKDIALKYRNDPTAMDKLASKIINGGGGVWKRDFVMIGHPTLSKKAATEMVKYIYTLADEKPQPKKLAPNGTLTLQPAASVTPDGSYYIMASYIDKAGSKVRPLEAKAVHTFRSPRIQSEAYSGYGGQIRILGGIEDGDKRYLNLLRGGNIFFNKIDLTDVGSLTIQYSAKNVPGTMLEVRIDSEKGEMIGNFNIQPTGQGINWKQTTISLKETKGKHDIYIVANNPDKSDETKALVIISVDWINFNLNKARK